MQLGKNITAAEKESVLQLYNNILLYFCTAVFLNMTGLWNFRSSIIVFPYIWQGFGILDLTLHWKVRWNNFLPSLKRERAKYKMEFENESWCAILLMYVIFLKDYKHFQSCLSLSKFLSVIKIIYSKKASKFCKITTSLLSYEVPVKSKVEILQYFVAFSEYMNFKISKANYDVLNSSKKKPLA